jgi:hypothetical protein
MLVLLMLIALFYLGCLIWMAGGEDWEEVKDTFIVVGVVLGVVCLAIMFLVMFPTGLVITIVN